jgi:glycerophosphoryl diester phosphodiesterase
MGYAPENTLKSIERALELGVPWVEIDVQYVDGHLIVIHDDRLERTTNGTGYVLDKSFSFLRTLDAGEGEKIPTLEEVLDLVSGRAGINIELKSTDAAGPVVELIGHVVRQNWDVEQFLVSSFIHHEIRKVKQMDDRIRIGALVGGIPIDYAAFAEGLTAYSVNASIEFINREFVKDAHSRGLRIFIYTVNHPDDVKRMMSLKVDGVFSDYPDRVLSILERTEEVY